MKRHIIYSAAIAVTLLFNSCATNPVTGKRDVSFVSEGQELAMGQEADPQIVAQYGLVQNPTLQKFIQEKGQQMAAVSHRPNLKYEFKIVDSPILNAFAVPGGYVYFTRGIMAHFNNEAQFAGVLGHEIGHITARHSAQQQTKAIITQGVLLGGMIAFPDLAQFGDLAGQGASLLFLKFGRDDERQSDELGVEYSTKIGYNAHEMADFFQTLARQGQQAGQGEIPEWQSTHPNPTNRYSTVHQLADQWQQKVTGSQFAVNRDSYLRMIDGLVYGEDPKQGFVENSIFYHPELKFQFPIPANWQYQNTPQQVQMAPKDGKALMFLRLAQGTSLEAAAQQMVQANQLQVIESKQVTVNGLPALALIGQQTPPQDQQQTQQQQAPIQALSYFIQYGGNIYNLTGVTAATDFNTYFPSFSNTMQNFRQLTDPEKINRKPEVVSIKKVTRDATLSQALKSFNMPDKRLEELAILNGMTLTAKVSAGTLIKVLERR
ncbi:M48 family metalloprotease [Rufibacter quisquiliarum]|uniref:Putative Zn-dependent protease n=1 Tax=Rufibacter quisquiliarum TaxID=1549639 RepID=A0A839GN28_9BACT|nr:M48 family metalloprotease [Rufibacter quisquiliarum]MBA9076327.1 putative Zn-dependent protease [Rufibacter quisquiliarum]